jgi:hypothetical protein
MVKHVRIDRREGKSSGVRRKTVFEVKRDPRADGFRERPTDEKEGRRKVALFPFNQAALFVVMACLSGGVPAAPVPAHRSNAECLHPWVTAMWRPCRWGAARLMGPFAKLFAKPA